jgi:hypothetical protein
MEKTPQELGAHVFDCQMYVSSHGAMRLNVPSENGPVRIARLKPLDYDELVDPSFRKLLATFESLPKSLQFAHV